MSHAGRATILLALLPCLAAQPLIPGHRTTRQLPVEKIPLRLAADDFLHVEVLQTGTDVAAALEDPTGKKLRESDLPNGAYGPETIALIAPVSGTFHLRIDASAGRSGSVGVEIRAHRPAMAEDRKVAGVFGSL